MRQFYLKYFTATEGLSWLACPSAPQRLKMLEELMQWEVTAWPRISELQTSCVTEYWCLSPRQQIIPAGFFRFGCV